MQTEDFVTGQDVFTSDYGYFSSMSESWLRHSRDFVKSAIERLTLGPQSFVVEVAANDGYLLQYVQAEGIPCAGIEPTHSTASAAREKGLAVEEVFLTEASATEFVSKYGQADLVVANNVIAHVPDVCDFIQGIAVLLKPKGTLTLEFAYGVELIEKGLFDTVYHEHFSYFTLTSLIALLKPANLQVVDVELLSSHGGSLRVYVQHVSELAGRQLAAYEGLLAAEAVKGVSSPHFYSGLQQTAVTAKHRLLRFLIEAADEGQTVVAYGAAAKGNTLINFAGVKQDLLAYVADRSPGKIGRYLPGSRIPVVAESMLRETKPAKIVVLPWNLEKEFSQQLKYVIGWGGQLWVPLPDLQPVGC
jgi:SAM-dependent methyltransferase